MNALKYTTFVLLLMALACTKPPDYPDEPVISFVGMDRNTVRQGNLTNGPIEQLVMTISFTDGDGDLGEMGTELEPKSNIYLTDSRTGFQASPLTVPFIPEQGAGNGISGNMRFNVSAPCCIYLGTQSCEAFENLPIDTLTYSIQVQDRAGNISNTIESDPVFLLCI